MILYLNTTHFSKAVLELRQNSQIIAQRQFATGKKLNQKLLPQIDLLLKEKNLTITTIKAIQVARHSQETFTGSRIGVAVANALGFALGVTVNGQKFVTPTYQETKAQFTIKPRPNSTPRQPK